MKRIICLNLILSLLLLISCDKSNKQYIKQVSIEGNFSDSKKIELASSLVPTEAQLERQHLDLAALVSFGVNTFTGREWGTGRDNLLLFNPTSLDVEQWVKTLKKAGFKLVIITAKHHDGFCLWPTRTTPYSVASTPWKSGSGDLIKEVQSACEKHDIKFGIYISVSDRSSKRLGIEDCYGLFKSQLEELLTNYGHIYELWIDNINYTDTNSKQSSIDWKEIKDLISLHQPNTLVAGIGDDIRYTKVNQLSTELPIWSITSTTTHTLQYKSNNTSDKQTDNINIYDLKNQLSTATNLYWYPSETIVPLRPSWFYKPKQDNSIKSLFELAETYHKTIGNNTMLLLGISPNKEGLIPNTDSLRLMEFKKYLDQFTTKNLIELEEKLNLEQQPDTLVFSIRNQPINTLEITENIKNGQRVENFQVQLLIDKKWTPIAQGSTIGHKKIVKLNRLAQSDSIRLITKTLSNRPYISNFRAFYIESPIVSQSTKVFSEVGRYRWRVISPIEEGESIIDNNITTSWIGKAPLIINFRKSETFSGFIYTPSTSSNNYILEYSLLISDDNKSWVTIIDHDEFGNIVNNPIQQYVRFSKKVTAQYIKLIVHKTNSNDNFYAIAELGLVK